MRLAKLHDIKGVKVALLLPQVASKKGEVDKAPVAGCVSMLVPTWEQGRAGLRWFWVKALCTELPSLPTQQTAKTKVDPKYKNLVTLHGPSALQRG